MTRIESVTATPISVPLQFVTALRRTETTDTVVVTVTDRDGRTGWGEAPQVWQVTGESLARATACVKTMLGPALVGHDVGDRGALTTAAALSQRSVARNFGAKAAVDGALHDLVAQAEGTTVAALLADTTAALTVGLPSVLTTEVTLSAGAPQELAETARSRVAEGFTTVKMKVGTDAATDVSRVAAVRAAVGDRVDIRLDANQGWSRDEAVAVIRSLDGADLRLAFVEQPLVADDVEGLAWVRERMGLRTIVGSMMESHIGLGAATSLVAAEPTTEVSDLDAAWWSTRSPVIGGITYVSNEIRLPAGPGLGISGWQHE